MAEAGIKPRIPRVVMYSFTRPPRSTTVIIDFGHKTRVWDRGGCFTNEHATSKFNIDIMHTGSAKSLKVVPQRTQQFSATLHVCWNQEFVFLHYVYTSPWLRVHESLVFKI